MTDDFHVAALKRQRAHLKDVGADRAKVAENAELLRLAGVDVDELDKPAAEDKPARSRADSAPVDRRAPERQTVSGVTSDFLSKSKPGKEPNAADKPDAKEEPNRADKPEAKDAPNAPNPKKQSKKDARDISGSGGIVLPKPEGKAE